MKAELRFNCPKKWDDMDGDDSTRHCTLCDQTVHNVSEMSIQDAQALIATGTSCTSIRVNERGQIKTKAGFSSGLLLMSLAVGCGDGKEKPGANGGGNIDTIDQVDIVGELKMDTDQLSTEDCESDTKNAQADDPHKGAAGPIEVQRYVGRMRRPDPVTPVDTLQTPTPDQQQKKSPPSPKKKDSQKEI